MVDRGGGTPALGKIYLAVGPIVKLVDGDLTISVGEGSVRAAGKPFSMDESETVDLDLVLNTIASNALHAARPFGFQYTFTVDETGVVQSVDILHNGKILSAIGDITIPVAVKTGKLGVTTWQSNATPPTDWTLRLWKNGSNTKASSVSFDASPSTFKYQSQDWGSEETFAAGDHFRVECASTGGSDATDPRLQIAMILEPT
jgi:hypothetical protein